MEIKRDVYLNRLIIRKHNGFIKVITGIRRCGKSYLLNTLFYNHLIENGISENHIIVFAFDSAEDLIKIGEDPLLLDNSKQERKASPQKFLEYLNRKIIDDEMYYLLLDVISSGISTLTNPRKLSATFASVKQTRISEVTVDKYIEHMEDAFMLNRVRRYDVKGRKYIGTPYKIYFEDVGIRNARLNFRQIEGTHIMENIIYNELRYRGYAVDVGVVESRERDTDGREIRKQLEIDFIAVLGGRKYYIQSAYAIPDADKYKQETRSFDKVNDSFRKIILVEKSMKPRHDENGYVLMGIKERLNRGHTTLQHDYSL